MSTSTARPLRADALRNRNAVVVAARAAFVDRGVDASLEDIARSASVGPGTLYRHFPTRADLVAAAIAHHVEDLRAAAEHLKASPLGSEHVLREWLRLLSDYSGAYGGLADSVLAASSRGGSLGEVCRELEALTDDVLDRVKARGGVREDVIGEDVFVLANALAWANGHDPEGTRVTDRLDIMIRGMLA